MMSGTPQITGLQMPQAAPAAAPEPEKDEGRDYIVLKKIPADSPGGSERFEKVAVSRAGNPEQAMRRAAEAPGSAFLNTDGATTLVAVPARNWSTITVEVETTTRLKLS